MLVQILLVGSLLAPDGALRTVRLRLNHLGEDGEASALVVLVVHRHLRLLHLLQDVVPELAACTS